MTNINNLIRELKGLDLKTRPEIEIIELFRKIGTTININYDIGINSILLKARPNNNHPRFKETKDLSIKPAKDNTDYQRASTPLKSMFYAVYMPNCSSQNELNIMRCTGVYETIPEVRTSDKSYQGKVTYGHWKNKEKLNLLAIMHNETYISTNKYTKELANAYKIHLRNSEPHIKEKSLKFYEFMADEFSKETIRGNYDYMISALYSEAASRFNIDGVIYPSVRVGGKCFNIAIKKIAKQKLELDCVEEAVIKKIGKNINVDIKAFAKIANNQDTFNLVDVPNRENNCR